MSHLLFIYKADSKLKSKLFDYTHKLFSPSTYQCHLCSITHHNFGKRTEWQDFLEKTNLQIEVSYRDQFLKKYPQYLTLKMPHIFLVKDGVYKPLIDSEELEKLSLKDLITRLSNLD